MTVYWWGIVQVWGALEHKHMFKATYLYLLARYTFTRLRVDTDPQRAKLIASFPILQRQWASISHFREVIIHSIQLLTWPLICYNCYSYTTTADVITHIIHREFYLDVAPHCVVSTWRTGLPSMPCCQCICLKKYLLRMLVTSSHTLHCIFH